MAKKKERLKPISFYGHEPEDIIRAFMQVDPKRIRELEEEERRAREEESRQEQNRDEAR